MSPAWFQPKPHIRGLPETGSLGFVPRASVRWLGPRGLAVTGYQVFLSGIFSRYADKREVQAALKSPQIIDRSDDEELWFDWLADTGDGFDATYATAALLAEPTLVLAAAEGEPPTVPTQRGRLLLLGGDLAYPAANPEQYRDRMEGPFRAALPSVAPGQVRPTMLAVAGNHDWYDSLTSFLRLYCCGRDIGGWRTEQSRSYFTVKLPHRWWLIGIDLALDEFIDVPQLDYFTDVVNRHMQPGDRVILALHVPSWLFGGLDWDVETTRLARSNLEEFEREVLYPSGVQVELTIAGDIHHYNRYEREDGSQTRITSGAGAAFLYPTHHIPERIRWQEADGVQTYERRSVYPDRRTSKRLRWRILLAPFLNPSFILFIGLLYWLFAINLVESIADEGEGLEVMRRIDVGGLSELTLTSAGVVVVFAILVAGLIVFANCRTLWGKALAGSLHALMQLDGLIWAAWLAAQWGPSGDTILWESRTALLDLKVSAFAMTYGLSVLVLGGLIGSFIYTLYLFVMHVGFRKHPTHAFSAHRWEHHRSFLRLHIDTEGVLTVYSIGVRRVPRRWRYVGEADREPWQRWFEPLDRPIEAHLVERSLRFEPDG